MAGGGGGGRLTTSCSDEVAPRLSTALEVLTHHLHCTRVVVEWPSENCSVDTIHLERYFEYDFLHDLVRSVDTVLGSSLKYACTSER